MSQRADCPDCGSSIKLPDDVMEGEIVRCFRCGLDLEVVEVDPVVLQLPAEDDEDETDLSRGAEEEEGWG